MLGKLLKYETKATARLFLPIYIAILLLAFVNRLVNPFERVGNTLTSTIEGFNLLNIIRAFSGFLYFGLIVAAVAMTLIIMIQRFYKNLLSDEGYLMFTLPVETWQHIISKLLVSMLWVISSFLVIICSILILVNVDNLFGELSRIISSARDFLGDNLLVLFPVLALIASAYFILTVYNALAIGHLFAKNKIIASFGAYMAIYFVSQIVFAIFLFATANWIFVPLSQSTVAVPPQLIKLIGSLIFLYLLLGVGNFLVANFILNKKLNLE
ncbi:MAG: hypothetical protein GX375_01055 [Clostridiales bacterium]|nr:hypothetical protein [Clostridiales bacterium]